MAAADEEQGREASALVVAAKAGDPRAFDELVRRYRPRIYALALHLTGSKSDADDITQDAFLRAFRKIGQFEGRSEFFTWLYRIALHRALNARRDGRRRSTMDLEDPRVSIAVQVDAADDPRRQVELRETYKLLVSALDRLSNVLRTTVVLTTLQGLSYKEAAVVLETTEGTVAWRVHEARQQIKAALEEKNLERMQRRARKASGEQQVQQPSDQASIELALAMIG